MAQAGMPHYSITEFNDIINPKLEVVHEQFSFTIRKMCKMCMRLKELKCQAHSKFERYI